MSLNKLVNSVFFFFCSALLFMSSIVFAQAESSRPADDVARAVEIKDDSFGGVRVVRMKPQVLLDEPDHKLTLGAEKRKHAGEPPTGVESIDDRVTLNFISLASHAVNFGDREVRFRVDGKPVDVGGSARASDRTYRGRDAKRPLLKTGEELITVLSLTKLKEITSGSRIEMRLGALRFTLSDELLARLRDFVLAASR